MDKRNLRLKIKKDLEELNDENYLEHSKSVSKNLLSLIHTINSKHCFELLKLGVFSPFQKEPLWFSEFSNENINYLLVHMHKELQLSFHPVGLEMIKAGEFSFELPSEVREKSERPNIILVPGIGFSKTGARLGRGKGYFDRFLENSESVKIGVCFELQISDEVKCESHDVEMDYIVTEQNIYKKGKI